MLERLDRAFRGQRRLTADVSHELRTPLTALRGEIEVALRMERSPETYRRVLHSALEEIDRLTALTEELLLITRVEGHALKAHRVPIDFNALVREAATAFEAGLEGKRVTLALELADGLGDVSVDAGLMRRVVRHLLENAAKFTPEGDRMTVVTSRDARSVRLAIIDSGPGLAPEDLPHIFEPFYRADQARTSGTGLGLGLSLAAAIARLHGATLTAENLPPPAGGARFELAIPAERPVAVEALVSAVHQA
jgi:signal transduction histidine kinase